MPGLGQIGLARYRSIRTRLLLLALLPLGVVLPVLMVVLAWWGGGYFEQLRITKVRSDLAVAHGYFDRVREGVGSSLASLAVSEQLARTLRQAPNEREPAINALLASVQGEQRLDFLHFLPVDRKNTAESLRPAVAAALAGRASTYSEIFSAAELHALSPELAVRARTPLLPTANARPDTRNVESRGLVIHTAAPVRSSDGRLLGVLEGGVLLNKNLDFIDQLNAIVYPEGALPFGSAGTATLFLGDVRIATNVRLFAGDRAIGTRVSSAVQAAVLGEGRTWLDRAFVVSDWYVSAYEPLRNARNEPIGMLYVGYLEGPFLKVQQQLFAGIALLFALAMLVAGVFAALWARRVFRPIEKMHATMHAIEHGDASARVGDVGNRDELGIVAAHFDRLLDQLQAQTDSLKRWGAALDGKVAERTAELEQAVTDLKASQNQLVLNEKLAAIGQLTAGVAHEINNPIAVIQGNLDVLRDLLGAKAAPVEPEIKLIHEQVQRIRLIVTKLLQFARPQDYAGVLEPTGAAQLVQDSLLLVRHLLKQGNIVIEPQLETSRQILCNKSEVQQVLINLLVNAIQAMPHGGVIRVLAEDWDVADMPIGLRLSVIDSGLGIPPDDLARLFQPFFTAKKPGGNGLGLWVSKTLIERHGGDLTASSELGLGATFSLWLRCEPLE